MSEIRLTCCIEQFKLCNSRFIVDDKTGEVQTVSYVQMQAMINFRKDENSKKHASHLEKMKAK